MRHSGDHKPEERPVPLRIFHGNRAYAGKFQQQKLEKKHLDMIVANNLKVAGRRIRHATPMSITIITDDAEISLGKMTKEETAAHIISQILKEQEKRK